MFGYRMYQLVLYLTGVMVIGYIQTKAGPGFPIIHGDGRHFIMAVGTMIRTMDPFGFREMNGDRDGLLGEDLKVITDGHQ
jgi:hypothetical protein